MSKKVWAGLFLGLTAVVIGLEVFAANDHNPNTTPWTDYILGWLDVEMFGLVFGGFVLWAAIHFFRRYARKKRAAQEAQQRRSDIDNPG